MRLETRGWRAVVAIVLVLASGCTRTLQPGAGADSASTPIGEIIAQRSQRERQSAWMQLGEVQRQRIRDASVALAALPVDEQARLRAEFAQLDRSEQRGWLLGPQVGATWPQLSPLFSYVPEDERAPLLDALGGMDPGTLQMLGRIAWRTPPEKRDALRRELIAVPAANRATWVRDASER